MRGAAVAVLLVTVLTGSCVAGPARDASRPVASPSVVLPSANDWPPPSVLEFEEPEEPQVAGKRSTPADVLTFTTYLADEMSWMLRTTFNAPVLRDHDCPVCTDVVALADTARADRLAYEFDDVAAVVARTVRLRRVDPADPSQYWQVLLVLERPEITVRDEHGEQVEVLPAERIRSDLRLAALHGRWYLLDWFDSDRAAA